jgi:hypothetical protein
VKGPHHPAVMQQQLLPATVSVEGKQWDQHGAGNRMRVLHHAQC